MLQENNLEEKNGSWSGIVFTKDTQKWHYPKWHPKLGKLRTYILFSLFLFHSLEKVLRNMDFKDYQGILWLRYLEMKLPIV